MRRTIATLVAALALATLAAFAPMAAAGAPGDAGQRPVAAAEPRPLIFVHGGGGSAAQFESQAMRFTSNGYPDDRLAAHEYDSTFATNTLDQVWAGLDALIADRLAATGADRVDLAGHSLGTTVLQGYLNSSPERAARVAHYVNIDGRSATALPGGVPTLAVWGEGNAARTIVGAENYRAPDQSHVQVATSPETFAQMYRFLTGAPPTTTDVVAESPGRVRISGEANLFPSNIGAAGTTLEIWRVKASTGERRGDHPRATFTVAADGSWGPFAAVGGQPYELVLSRGDGSAHHFYMPPFPRSDHFVRLLTSEPGTGIDLVRDQSDHTTSLTIARYKEWWGDQGAQNDVLEVAGTNLATPVLAPRVKRVNAMFAFDDGVDGVTNLAAPIPELFALPFISGADLVIPATTPPDSTVPVRMVSRTGGGESRVINVRNWASGTDHITVQFPDFDSSFDRVSGHT
jgi:pimeloyl-ACP methyl ester carboxylesterase